MAGFLSAHGYDPGPTQRPLLAGAITGFLATVPAIGLLWAFGSLQIEARILGLSVAATLAAGWPLMALAGAIYSRLFGRAANDRGGGWLSGMAFGFLVWAAGAVLVLPLASGGVALAGPAALGVFLEAVGTWRISLTGPVGGGPWCTAAHRPSAAAIEPRIRSAPCAERPIGRRSKCGGTGKDLLNVRSPSGSAVGRFRIRR